MRINLHSSRLHLPTLPRWLAACLLASCVIGSAMAADTEPHAALKRKINLPPSAELHYSIEALQSGLQVNGEGLVKWRYGDNKYSVNSETRAMLIGKILETSSTGNIDGFGLAPLQFVEKRLRRDPSTTSFDRDAKSISFSQSQLSYPLLGGEQDRTSIIWQLIAVARGNANKFSTNSEWLFFVAGPRDAQQWSFKVIGREKIQTERGNINTVHLLRTPPAGDQGQKLDIWLAPESEWYPVRLRFSDPNGDFIEQTLDKISKPG